MGDVLQPENLTHREPGGGRHETPQRLWWTQINIKLIQKELFYFDFSEGKLESFSKIEIFLSKMSIFQKVQFS